ncbi:MAG: NnrS family protein [Leptospira sp.]|nr:NnrS family protein [Leptospira sp.]
MNLSQPIWFTAFRSFFLFGSLYSVVIVLIWLLVLFEFISSPFLGNAIHWHAYEMIFGFSRAIVYGFIFTAAQNWTAKSIVKGNALFALFLFWFLGRFAFLDIGIFSYLSYGFDVAASVYSFILLAGPLWMIGQEHNRKILYIHFIMVLLHILTGLLLFNPFLDLDPMDFIHLSLFSIVLYIITISGRVLPFFTGVVVPGYGLVKKESLEEIIMHTSWLFLLTELLIIFLPEQRLLAGSISLFLGIANFIRFLFWKPWVSIRFPILWILYSGYFWLCIGFMTNGFFHFGMFPVSSSFHFFGIGAIGIFIYGMITRVSLGHTGRKIVASKPIVVCYFLINIAVLLRTILPIFNKYSLSYTLSGSIWILVFSIFVILYAKILITKRPDGKPS